MESEAVHYQFTVREHHLDTFGHVNHATYLVLFEEARWDWITRNGYGLREVQEKRQGPVILEARVKYKKELVLRETVTISSWVKSYKRLLAVVYQEMENEDKALCCSAEFTFGLFDLEKRRLIAPTPEWGRALGLSNALTVCKKE